MAADTTKSRIVESLDSWVASHQGLTDDQQTLKEIAAAIERAHNAQVAFLRKLILPYLRLEQDEKSNVIRLKVCDEEDASERPEYQEAQTYLKALFGKAVGCYIHVAQNLKPENNSLITEIIFSGGIEDLKQAATSLVLDLVPGKDATVR